MIAGALSTLFFMDIEINPRHPRGMAFALLARIEMGDPRRRLCKQDCAGQKQWEDDVVPSIFLLVPRPSCGLPAILPRDLAFHPIDFHHAVDVVEEQETRPPREYSDRTARAGRGRASRGCGVALHHLDSESEMNGHSGSRLC